MHGITYTYKNLPGFALFPDFWGGQGWAVSTEASDPAVRKSYTGSRPGCLEPPSILAKTPRASIMDLAEPLRNSPLEAGLHPRKSKVMQCSWIQIEFTLYKL